MGWLGKTKALLTARVEQMESAVSKHIVNTVERHAEHETQLRVIHTNQDHLTARLDEIRGTTKATNEKLDSLGSTITSVLMAVKAKR